MYKTLLLGTFFNLIFLSASAQDFEIQPAGTRLPAKTARPFEKVINQGISKSINDNDKVYVLASASYGKMYYDKAAFDENTPSSSPLIMVYDSEGKKLSVNDILTTDHYAIDLFKIGDRIFVCGRFLPEQKGVDPYNRQYRDSMSEGFVAEFGIDLKLKKVQKFPGLVFWKVISDGSSIYLTGQMTRKEVEVNGKKYQSHVEIPKTSEDDEEVDYNDAILLRLNADMEPEKFGHYAIDGYLQDGEYLVANSNGYVAFALNTVILRGADHHDGNMFLVDNNFNMLWHKQYTDLYLGKCHVMPLALNKDNEVLAYTVSHFALESRRESSLPDYNDANKNEMIMEGIVRYNSEGKLLSKESLPADTTGYLEQKRFSANGNDLEFFRFYYSAEENAVWLDRYAISQEGKLTYKVPTGPVSPVLFYYSSYNPYSQEYRLLFFDK